MMRELIVGRPCVLVIDMQHDFLDPGAPCYAPGVESVIPTVAGVVNAAREAGVPVIYTAETHRPNRVDSGREADPGTGAVLGLGQDAPAPEHCIEGTRGNEVVSELEPQPGDFKVVKRRYNSFLGTELDILLHNLDVETLFLTGVDSNVCVLCTALEGHQLDYHVRVIEDAVAGTSPEEHEGALLIMRNIISGRRITSEEVLSAFSDPVRV
jgi:biuret amidohydrolase